MPFRKFWVKLDIPNFILDLKITAKCFVKWGKRFPKTGQKSVPRSKFKDKSVENQPELRKL